MLSAILILGSITVFLVIMASPHTTTPSRAMATQHHPEEQKTKDYQNAIGLKERHLILSYLSHID